MSTQKTVEKRKNNTESRGKIIPGSIIIEGIAPEIDGGMFPIKRVVGERVTVEANVFTDGHNEVRAQLLYRKRKESSWQTVTMTALGNDRFRATFAIDALVPYVYTIQGYVDHFRTWQKAIEKKNAAGQDISVEYVVGANLIKEASMRAAGKDGKRLKELARLLRTETIVRNIELTRNQELTDLMDAYIDKTAVVRYPKELVVSVEQERANFSAWYELFPRSASTDHARAGTLTDCIALLPAIADMGFDVMYLPPIHPIGECNRKGKNNSEQSEKDDPGCPWAIGSKAGGHKAIAAELGTARDFARLVKDAKKYNIAIALDIAFQCAPDHPYITQHKKWFKKRPDGTIQYAENPPKKYQDVVPFDFDTSEAESLWDELKDVVMFWAKQGVRIFRVDNPHTKPFHFWDWLISEVKKTYPETLFLAEAFTRPKVMNRLAKGGFSQSYTYFTWRNTKKELIEYLTTLTQTEVREYFRPNFWPNTPDILPEFLQYGGRPGFIIRFILAATLSSNYGIYGPPFELCIDAALPGREEYLDSEKYEICHWDRRKEGNLVDLISRVNQIRKENPALQTTSNIQFYDIDNDAILVYGKVSDDLSNIIIVAVNIDPRNTQSGWMRVPLEQLGLHGDQPYFVHDLLSDDKYIWEGERNYIELNPAAMPAHILRVRRNFKREADFDYFF